MRIRLNRKKFLKIFLSAIGIFLLYLWNQLVNNLHSFSNRKKQIIINNDIPHGITFSDDLIIVKKYKDVKVLSSKCSHLGCRITKSVNDIFICPCHGSQFNTDGEVIKGPANKNLISLNYKLDQNKNKLIIFT